MSSKNSDIIVSIPKRIWWWNYPTTPKKNAWIRRSYISNYNLNIMATEYLPIKARITVSNGAAGNDIFVLNSNICRSSSMNRNIWCCEYLRSIDMETVWKLLNDKIKAVRTH